MKVLSHYTKYIAFKGLASIVFNSFVIVMVSAEKLPKSFLLIIIQEFYFSYFLTAMRTRRINSEEIVPLVQLIIISSLIFLSLILLVGGAVEWHLFGLSLFTFCIFSKISTELEKKNVYQSVQIEYQSALTANIVLSIIVAINYFYSGEVWIGLIFGRFLFFHIIYIWVVSKKILDFDLSEILKFENKFWPPKIPLLSLILGSFFVKFSFFFVLEGGGASVELGTTLKFVIIGYDILAAVMGLFMRRAVAYNSKDKKAQNRYLLTVISIFSLVSIALIFIIDPTLNFYLQFSVLPLFVLASMFVPISNYSFLIRITYVIILFGITYLVNYENEKAIFLILLCPFVLIILTSLANLIGYNILIKEGNRS